MSSVVLVSSDTLQVYSRAAELPGPSPDNRPHLDTEPEGWVGTSRVQLLAGSQRPQEARCVHSPSSQMLTLHLGVGPVWRKTLNATPNMAEGL